MPSRVLVLAALLATVVLVACGSDGDGAGAQTTATADGTAPATTTAQTTTATSAAAKRGVKLVTVGTFDQPLYVTAPPADQRRIFVVEQGGRIKVVRGGRTLATPFLDVTSKVTWDVEDTNLMFDGQGNATVTAAGPYQIIAQYGGNVLQLTIGDKGAYLYAVFGSPNSGIYRRVQIQE